MYVFLDSLLCVCVNEAECVFGTGRVIQCTYTLFLKNQRLLPFAFFKGVGFSRKRKQDDDGRRQHIHGDGTKRSQGKRQHILGKDNISMVMAPNVLKVRLARHMQVDNPIQFSNS